ncbi:MAG: ATP-binding cassette domain-containing protein, partial [Pyrinomonadaceae bacterium]|nr:ATP-binding cassette domain-containing protein [Sphingobacteriaceae bacterium]
MLKINSIRKTFHPGEVNEVKALQGVTLELRTGEFMVVVGANGSGKSTLLNAISGAVFPDSGELMIDGNAVTHLAEHHRSKWISRVFQNPLSGTASDLTILENFRLASLRTGTKKVSIGINQIFKEKVQEKIALLGMGLEDKILQPMGT